MDKTLYQKIFQGYKCNNLIYEINPKKMFVWESQNKLQELQVSQNEIFRMMIFPVFSQFLKFESYFLGLPLEVVFGVITEN